VSWTPSTCHPSGSWPNCPSQSDAAEKNLPEEWGPVTTAPFWVYTPVACDWSLDRAGLAAGADALTVAHTAYATGQALWLGVGLPDDPSQPTLRRAAIDVTPAAGPHDLDDAVATLLAEYEVATGGNGGAVLHVPGLAMTAMLGAIPGGSVVARLEGTHYIGPLGSLVSPGPGYPFGTSLEGADGFGPLIDAGPPEVYAGTDEDQVWVYVTGPVEWAAGPLQPISDPVGAELRRNRQEVWSERQAIVRFDPCATFACLANSPVGFEGMS
jgi:hypothetical protein